MLLGSNGLLKNMETITEIQTKKNRFEFEFRDKTAFSCYKNKFLVKQILVILHLFKKRIFLFLRYLILSD